MIHLIILLLLATPFLGFTAGLFIEETNEKALSRLAIGSVIMQFILSSILTISWSIGGFQQINLSELNVFQNPSYHFFIDFLIDKISISFIQIGSFLALMVTIFSQYYLHREEGYKRFFLIILLFYFG
ncbi:MAG: hypothetical protein ACK58Q_00770 [Chitinophagales bacterium]